MVNSRIYIRPTRRTVEKRITCRLYSSKATRPGPANIAVRCTDGTRKGLQYANVESMLDGAVLQPYIHDCVVTVHELGVKHRFAVYFKRHIRLPINTSINGNGAFRGDVVVMRVSAANTQSVVNLRGRDASLADWMLPRFALRISTIPRGGLPRRLSYYK